MSEQSHDLFLAQTQHFRVQRHDFLNQLQVIRGFLQLQKPERALATIDAAIAELGPQQEISRIAQNALQALLLHWYFSLRALGVETELYIPEIFNNESFWAEGWSAREEAALTAFVQDCLAGCPELQEPDLYTAEIRLTAEAGLGCAFTLYREDEVVQRFNYA